MGNNGISTTTYVVMCLLLLAVMVACFGPWTNAFWKNLRESKERKFKIMRYVVFVVLAISALVKFVVVLLE